MMRKVLVVGAVLLGCSRLEAGVGAYRPAAPPLDRNEAQNYAHQLTYVVNLLADQNVRPLSRSELMTAALAGLYEAARVPAPAALPAQVRKAVAEQELLPLINLGSKGLDLAELLRDGKEPD